MWRRWIPLFIAAPIVLADQITKQLIRDTLLPGESFAEVCRVTIIHLQNTGSAFGLFTDQRVLLTIVAFIGLVVIIVFYRQLGIKSKLGSIAIGMIFGGAIGNLIDRIRLGHVTDFFYVRLWGDTYWPAFNVADACVSVGMILLIWFMFTTIWKGDEKKS